MDFDAYMRELADGSVRLKVSSLARLSGLTPERAMELAKAWLAIDVRRRRRVVQELIDLAEDNVEFNFDAVFFRGLEDEDADVRLESVRGLWEHDGAKLIEPLIRVVDNDQNAAVRAEAALALGRFVVLSEAGKLRESHFQSIEAALRRVLDNEAEVDEVRARALEAIGAHDESWVRQAIREAYESGIRRLKVSAVHAMGRSCESRWLPLVLRELAHEEAEVRYEAAVACGSLADEGAVPHLARLVSDSDEQVKQAGIAALGEIGGQAAKDALRELVDSPSPAVRDAALAALAEIDFEEDPLSVKYRI